MGSIEQIVEGMQTVLGPEADRLARETGFIKRQGKVSGSGFVQVVVFGFQANPDLTYTQLSGMAASAGLSISPQGLEQRFGSESARFLQRVLERAVQQVIEHDQPAVAPLLARFTGVYVRDSTILQLPQELQHTWRGLGGNQGPNAALKLQVSWNYSTGQVHGPVLQDGRSADQTSPYQAQMLPAGALRLADLGYFSIKQLAQDHRRGVYWLSRLKYGTVVLQTDGQRLDLLPWLRTQAPTERDEQVLIGQRERVPARLLASRVPQEVADQRRRRLREAARVKGKQPSAEQLALADWTLLITNTASEQLSLPEARILLRVRWQVELLFKVWKSRAKIDEWRSHKPWRILTEIYAKLLGLLLHHWVAMVQLWPFLDRSLSRAVAVMQQHALALLLALPDSARLHDLLARLYLAFAKSCRLSKRAKTPATFQLLAAALP